MPIITEVRFVHPNGALADALRQHPGLDIAVVQEARTDPEGDAYFMRVDDPAGADVEAVLAADASVGRVEPMPGFEGQRLWSVEFTASTELLAPSVTRQDGLVLDARSTDAGADFRGWRERWLLPDREALHDIWQDARDRGFEFEVLQFRPVAGGGLEYSGPSAPTDQQREALVAAYRQGYFAEPRETSLAELAESLELSPTAVAGRLRRGMKSLISMTLLADRGGD